MKGKWIIGLIENSLQRSISLREAAAFALARFRSKPVRFSLHGVQFLEADHILWSIAADVYLNRVYSPPGMEIGPTDIVVDIGAHKGVFSGYAAQRTHEVVIAYEPDPTNFRLLKAFLELNDIQNVQFHQCAIGPSSGSGSLYHTASSSRHTVTGYDQSSGELLDNAIEVKMLSLDDALSNLNSVDLLKVDCEGAEIEILLGSSDRTLAKIRRMAIEIHDPAQSARIRTLQERLSAQFPRVEIQQQRGQRLGYLFAWQ